MQFEDLVLEPEQKATPNELKIQAKKAETIKNVESLYEGGSSNDSSAVKNTIQFELEINGEIFFLKKLVNSMEIFHPLWSLNAKGKTLIEAEHNLLQEAKDLAAAFLKIPTKKLTAESMKMRDFLLTVV